MRVALVIPARDEERFLPRVLAEIPEWIWRVVLVDDGSRDWTFEIMRGWNDRRAHCLRLRPGRGVGGAIVAGWNAAVDLGAEAVVVVAGDAQMDLGEIERLVGPLESGRADYVQGSRFDSGRPRGPMPRMRRWGNRCLSACAAWAAGAPVSDSQCGFTAASAAFLRALDLSRLPRRYGFPAFVRIEAHRMGARVEEAPVRAIYADEVSGIDPWRDPVAILARILWRGVRRRCDRQGQRVAAAWSGSRMGRMDGARAPGDEAARAAVER